MKNIMKQAVDALYNLLWLKQNDSQKYAETLEFGIDARCCGMTQARLKILETHRQSDNANY